MYHIWAVKLFYRFLTGPLNLNDPEAKCRFPKIFVNTDDTYEELHLIVYKVLHFSLQLFLKSKNLYTMRKPVMQNTCELHININW